MITNLRIIKVYQDIRKSQINKSTRQINQYTVHPIFDYFAGFKRKYLSQLEKFGFQTRKRIQTYDEGH